MPAVDWTDEEWSLRKREATERARKYRWSAGGVSKVTHRRFGSVVVPHGSALSAIECAADVWGCGWMEVVDAVVAAAEPGEMPVGEPEKGKGA